MDNKFAGKEIRFVEHNKTYTGVVIGLRCGAYLYVRTNEGIKMVEQNNVVILEE